MQFLPSKFNNLNAVKKHISKHKELKFKDIGKYQQQTSIQIKYSYFQWK